MIEGKSRGGGEIRNHDFDRNGHVDRTWVSFMKPSPVGLGDGVSCGNGSGK